MVAESHLAPEQEKPHSLSKAWWGLLQVQETMPLLLLLCCLDVAEQETLLSGIFCSKAVDSGASCFGEEV